MRVAICVVYVCDPGQEWLVDLHLRKIRETTRVPYAILAAAMRVTDAVRARLAASPDVVLVDVPPTELRGSPEHAHYLDALVAEAERRGFTHFATFDLDSFPVDGRWLERLVARLGPDRPFAAVFRAENGDVNLPHPSGFLCEMAFYRSQHPGFLPSGGETRGLVPAGQRPDTGIGYAIAAARNGVDWLRLTRSNARNDHALMAGIYGDVVFHLGAMSRPPVFRADWLTAPHLRLLHRWRKAGLLRPLRYLVSRRFTWRNRAIHARIFEALRTDPDGYIARLRGAEAAPQR